MSAIFDKIATGDLDSEERGSGARRNGGKLRVDLLPLHLLAGCARVFEYGEKKYKTWNWAKCMATSVAFASLMRHLIAWYFLGEDEDRETGEHHLDHCFCNLFMLRHQSIVAQDLDDRPGNQDVTMFSLEDSKVFFNGSD